MDETIPIRFAMHSFSNGYIILHDKYLLYQLSIRFYLNTYEVTFLKISFYFSLFSMEGNQTYL